MKKYFNGGYILVILGLFFYSFTQVDLSLTLSRAGIFQTVEKSFQNIGYFQRPLSTDLYILILILLFGYYIYFLRQAFLKKIKPRMVWIMIIFTAVALAFSYNAFSYDLFNYIFDAKIITHYHLNPYFHKALDFPGDPMLSFMQWTHRTYPYGPIWLVLTVPLSFLGSNIFLLTFFLFKFLAAGFYLGLCYLMWEISEAIAPDRKIFNTVLFALSPLVLIELLVSAHNESSMMFFALLGLYLFFAGRKILALISVLISSQIKIPTADLLLPVGLGLLPQTRIKLNSQKIVWGFIVISTGGLLYVLTKVEVQPWYFLWVFPFVCLLKPNKYVISLATGLSLGLLLRYTPYLFNGSWNENAPEIKGIVTLLTPVIFMICAFIFNRLRVWEK